MVLQDAISELFVILEEELRLHQALFDVILREKDIVISAQLKDLQENNISKDALLLKIENLTTKRNRLGYLLAGYFNLNSPILRLRDLMPRLPMESRERFRLTADAMEIIVGRIQEQNRENGLLIKSALETVQGALKSLKGDLADSVTYQKKGGLDKKTSSGQFVSKEV